MKDQVAIARVEGSRHHVFRTAGFTLIEMIGVLAILAILTAAITPVAVRRADIAARSKELSDLATISNALMTQVVKQYSIPNGNGWSGAVSSWLDRPIGNITNNVRNFNRVYLIDPTKNLPSPNPAVSGTIYAQNGDFGLTAAPTNARVMIVSTIARTNVPASINFNETWNWNTTLSPQAKPASWSGFSGTGDDVCIQRINLTPTFYQLILVNRDPGSTNALFNVNGAGTYTVTNGYIWNNYYIAGSTIGLWGTNGSGNNVISSTYVLNQNTSFVFENGMWNPQIQNALTSTNPPPPQSGSGLANNYNNTAISFFNALWNSGTSANGGKGASQTAVLSAFGNLMTDYTMWANATSNGVSIPFSSNGDNNNNLPMTLILNNEKTSVDQITGTSGNGAGQFTGLLHL